MEYGWADFIRDQQRHRSVVRKSFELSRSRLDRIRGYSKTHRIVYPEYKEAFDYVHELYPSVGVKQAIVYHTSKALLNEVGYVGIGGFYDTQARIVCVTDWMGSGEYEDMGVNAEYTIDEVLCHELIHYCANFRLPVASRGVEEEIAYGKSVGYLRLKGRSDDFIIEKNMLPYLMSVVDRGQVAKKVLLKSYSEEDLASVRASTIQELIKPFKRAIHKQTIEDAKLIGKKMLLIYGGDQPKEQVVRNKQLIIDDIF
jgi:hypothetical protein